MNEKIESLYLISSCLSTKITKIVLKTLQLFKYFQVNHDSCAEIAVITSDHDVGDNDDNREMEASDQIK